MEPRDALADALRAACAWWRDAEPGTSERQRLADEIESLEWRLFGTAPHARGRLQTG